MPSEIGHYEEGTMKRALLRRGHMKSDSTMELYSPLFDQSDPLVSVSNYCGEIELHGDFDEYCHCTRTVYTCTLWQMAMFVLHT